MGARPERSAQAQTHSSRDSSSERLFPSDLLHPRDGTRMLAGSLTKGAARMEDFLVTHMSEGLWSVIHQGQTLSATFKLVPKLSPSGNQNRGLDCPCRHGIGNKAVNTDPQMIFLILWE